MLSLDDGDFDSKSFADETASQNNHLSFVAAVAVSGNIFDCTGPCYSNTRSFITLELSFT